MGMLSMLAASAIMPMGTAKVLSQQKSGRRGLQLLWCTCVRIPGANARLLKTSNVHACTKRTGLQ